MEVADLKLFRKIIKGGFKQRRKMLKNNLSFLGLSEKELLDLFEELNFSPHARAEDLSLEKYALLANRLSGQV